MGFSNLISWFIIVMTAATLNARGITDIQTSARAAEALRPIAGIFTFAIFCGGNYRHWPARRTGACRICRLCLGEALGWPTGLSRLPRDAKAFYGTIVVGTLIGVYINFRMGRNHGFQPPYPMLFCAYLGPVNEVGFADDADQGAVVTKDRQRADIMLRQQFHCCLDSRLGTDGYDVARHDITRSHVRLHSIPMPLHPDDESRMVTVAAQSEVRLPIPYTRFRRRFDDIA
jgi:hypothetical protein